MPNRILREGIITSPRVILLSWPAEVFYRRLMSVVDDYGRYHAHLMLLRAACYPMQLDKVSDSDVGKWLGETRKAALVRVYEVAGVAYLELLDFRQQVRAKQSKFPQPPADDVQMPSRCLAGAKQMPADAHLDEVGGVGKALSGKPDRINGFRADAESILTFLNNKTGRHYEPVAANLEPLVARLREGSTPDEVRAVIESKCGEWLHDPTMSPYLRPATLFNRTKFAQYKGELGAKTPQRKVSW